MDRGQWNRLARRRGKVRPWWLVSGLVMGLALISPAVHPNTDEYQGRTAKARYCDFDALVVASGRIDSINNTEIRCALERVANGVTPTILSLIDDGTTVKKNDVLCEIDSSDYQELVRQQTITVQQARATHRQTELDLDVSKLGLEAYLNGDMITVDRQYHGQIALAKSDLSTRSDRLYWTERMVEKGYASVLQVGTDRQSVLAATLSLAQTERAFEIYKRFSMPKTLRALESQINSAKSQLDFQTIRLKREEERLELYQKMVERCTVRAPHAGFVIHANEAGRSLTIFEGAPVRMRQPLFKLPDLTKMEVQALLHETVVNRVKVGMPVKVQLEALPGLVLEGVVSSLSALPLSARKAEQGSDVTFFLGKIQLNSTPEGLRPGMTTELEITTAHREGVLAVPQTALINRNDRQYCIVLTRDEDNHLHYQQRAVTIGSSSHDMVEITGGLREGDEVLLDDSQDDTPLANRALTVADASAPASGFGAICACRSKRSDARPGKRFPAY